MKLRFHILSAIAYICLLAMLHTVVGRTTAGNLNNEEIQKTLQEMREWKEALSKDIETLKRTLWNEETSIVTKEKRSVNQNDEGGDGGASLASNPDTDCLPGTHGCPVVVTPYSESSSCILCPEGPRGYPGPPGPPGRDGRDAIAIVSTTTDSNSGTVDTNPDCGTTLPSNTSGAVYVRWGHEDCPATSTLLYSGVAAAPSYNDNGGGANQLCLSLNPVYESPVAGVQSPREYLYGVEYQVDESPNYAHKHWHDVPCAVCLATTRFAKLVIPGTNVCPGQDWTLEYGGFMMTSRSHVNHRRSMHVCVDRELQVLDRSSGVATDGKRILLNFVESRCSASGGGIPCGPYVDGYEITCAVCTL